MKIELVTEPLDDLSRYDDNAPAVIEADGDRVLVRHRRFAADLDLVSNHARVYSTYDGARELIERTILSVRLPLERGVLLHSAGIVIDDKAAIFFGPSGAGKTTLASLVDAALLSDELVAICDGKARATGTWGTLEGREAAEGEFPIAVLVELGRGDSMSLQTLDEHAAMRTLLNVAVVPPVPKLWNAALDVLASLTRTTPVMRLRWTPSRRNAAELLERIRSTAH